MQGAGVAIIRFFNGDATDKSSSVKLQRVRKQQKTDLTNTNVGGKNADKIDFIFQYKDGDEMVLSETNTGVIVVDSVRCSDGAWVDRLEGEGCCLCYSLRMDLSTNMFIPLLAALLPF